MATKSVTERNRLEAFRTRFGIDADPDAATRFRTRVVHAARETLVELEYPARYRLEREFAFRNGSKLLTGRTALGDPRIVHGILDELEAAERFAHLVESTQHLLWALEASGYLADRDRNSVGAPLVARLEQAIHLSPGVDLRLQRDGAQIELAPSGVPLLDQAIDLAMQWLARFPDVQKEFKQSLLILAERRAEQYRQAQDSLRFGLEKLLKLLLQNTLRLEDQGKPLKGWLTARGVHDNLRDAALQILGILTKHYQNAAVKHDNQVGDGAVKQWTDFEVEYMIYQYAALVRLLIEASE